MLTRTDARNLLDRLAERTARLAHWVGDRLPDYYDVADGAWRFDGFWTEGFWPGLCWELAGHSGDPRLAAAARQATERVIAEKATMDDHDLGFLYYPSCVLGFAATGDELLRRHALEAARRLARRYREDGRYIPAHGPKDGPQAGFAIIDTAMNLRLLLWAAARAPDEALAAAAVRTAETIVREHVRPDGSSCQVLWLDPANGRTVRREAVMAASIDSCWARGQAWGIHGFAELAEGTRDARWRTVAERMAHYFLSRVPDDGVVFHDLDDPAIPGVPKDTSAQAIAAMGLLILARAAPEAADAGRWRDGARRLLAPLIDRHLAPEGDGVPRGLVTNACKSLRKRQGVVSDIVFGDYYFVRALRASVAAPE